MVARLHGVQPGVSRVARGGLGRGRAERELAQLERHSIAGREIFDRPSDPPTVRPNPVVRVGDDEREPERGAGAVQEIQQRHRVGPARDGDERRARRGEQPGGLAVGAEAVGQRSGHI